MLQSIQYIIPKEEIMPFLVILAIVVVAALYLIGIYNSMASLKVRVKEAWSHIDVQLKRRIDLIPNLVETVKGYASHEKEVFENVTKARSALMNASTPQQAGAADAQLASALKTLFSVAEAYPDLKAQTSFMNLQVEVRDTEDKIAYSRQFYNSVTREYNEKLVIFPSNLVASTFGFKPEEFFEIEDAKQREAVKVDFGQSN